MIIKLISVFIVSTSILLGCASLHKKATTLLEGGAYEEALMVYEEILRNDPSDADAIVGQLKSREKYVDTKLIEVRLARMGGNAQNATDLLLKMVENENNWSFFPRNQVAFTQEEESGYAYAFVHAKTNEFLKNGHPLAALLTIRKYAAIFQNTRTMEYQIIQKQVQLSGANKCKALQSSTRKDTPYFGQFVNKFCNLWGDKSRTIASTYNEISKSLDLYSAIDMSIKINGLPNEIIGNFKKEIETQFRQSAWYSGTGKSGQAKVDISGSFISKISREPTILIHEYSVEIPYTAYESVMRTRQIPYATTEYVCTYRYPSGSICDNVPKTAYRTELYSEQVPVTRYRSEPRSQPYKAEKAVQFLAFFSKGNVSVGGQNLQLAINEKSELSSISHDNDMPEIGLHPKKEEFADPIEWSQQQAAAVASQIDVKISEAWTSKFCKWSNVERNIASSGEKVHKCLRSKKSNPPEFIDSWYQINMGISVNQGAALLGFDDI